MTTGVLLISCYELGHQPAGIAVPAGFLRRAGVGVEAMDVSVEGFDKEKVLRARFVGISVPMHTALRLGLRVAEEVRRINPACHICFYGIYASLNADYLLNRVADSIIGGECEQGLVALARATLAGEQIDVAGVTTKKRKSLPVLARLDYARPDRGVTVSLERYAKLERNGEQLLAGYTEASRGCLHHCTHCPIPPVYNGRFFVIPVDVVLEDVRSLVEAGARHITFGDPDFLNGPTHALRIANVVHKRFPEITFDFTAKIEHILKYRTLIPEFARSGCIFIISAVESLSDTVLARLEKGHTREDIAEALELVDAAGIALRPSFVAFTPWTTIDDYVDMLEFVRARELIYHVDPVQYSIRLLVPPGSLLVSRLEDEGLLGSLLQEAFTYEWRHPDPAMDELHRRVSAEVERAALENEDAAVTFRRIYELAASARGRKQSAPLEFIRRFGRPPRLTEAWFC
jgi:radical SAM superfamily enzyme YgiQ (UPF0313 family)